MSGALSYQEVDSRKHESTSSSVILYLKRCEPRRLQNRSQAKIVSVRVPDSFRAFRTQSALQIVTVPLSIG